MSIDYMAIILTFYGKWHSQIQKANRFGVVNNGRMLIKMSMLPYSMNHIS
jgi:hypothetical protein